MTHRIGRRGLLGAAAGAGAAAMLPGTVHAAARGRPNFVIVYVDDLGYGDIGATGGRRIRTPQLDRLARQGMTLTDYYAPANLCTPSRAGLLTGRYPVRTGLGRGVILQGDRRGLPLGEVTIGKALQPAYATALIGKWHLGNPGTKSWPPMQHGFDLFYGIEYSHDMLPLSLWEGDSQGLRQASVDYPRLQQQFSSRAERFIDENKDRPFFLELALSSPHLPNYPFNGFAGKSPAGAYGDVVEELDSIVGRLQAKIESLGLSRQTLVIFTSDNGPWFEGSAGSLRERKGGGGYDGASRVPFIASRPGTIPAGRRSDSIAMGIDMLPTLCAMAGIPSPPNVELDGRDLTAVLTRGAASPHDELLLFNDEDVVGIRTQRWKYIEDAYYRNYMLPLKGRGYPQLYDMRAGDESYSVASLHPDIVRVMEARLSRAAATYAPFRTAPSEILKMPPGMKQQLPAQWRD